MVLSPAPSAASVTLGEHDATPASASAQLNVTVTSALYQPSAFAGARFASIDGRVASRATVTPTVVVPPALAAVHRNVADAVSVVTDVGSQPVCEAIAESGSETVQLTSTSPTYQSPEPRVPVTAAVTTGGVVSAGVTMRAALAVAARYCESPANVAAYVYEPAVAVARLSVAVAVPVAFVVAVSVVPSALNEIVRAESAVAPDVSVADSVAVVVARPLAGAALRLESSFTSTNRLSDFVSLPGFTLTAAVMRQFEPSLLPAMKVVVPEDPSVVVPENDPPGWSVDQVTVAPLHFPPVCHLTV
jgi:hypothetical protein